jgi:hypothetical protein
VGRPAVPDLAFARLADDRRDVPAPARRRFAQPLFAAFDSWALPDRRRLRMLMGMATTTMSSRRGRPPGSKTKNHWPELLRESVRIIESYATGVTLRQLFYRLVARQLLENSITNYVSLSRRSAEARREGWFPDLLDNTRRIFRYYTDEGPKEALQGAIDSYRLDRTIGQEASIYLGNEKNGQLEQLKAWFGDLGIPLLPLGGYASQSFIDKIKRDVEERDRPAVLIYAGDLDPDGEDIYRHFVERTDCWDTAEHIALSEEQVEEYDLPVNPGKAGSARAPAFIERHGKLMQVEVDAIEPNELRRLYQMAIDRHWNPDAYKAVLRQEKKDVARISTLFRGLR